jgi:LysM repeat protein
MAIAPIEGTTSERPARGLRVLEGGRRAGAPPRGTALHARDGRAEALRRSRAAHPTAATRVERTSAPVANPAELLGDRRGADRGADRLRSDHQIAGAPRRAVAEAQARGDVGRRAQAVARRRIAGVAVVLAAVALLAMPLRALGAVTVAGQPTPAGVPAGLAPGSVYVVQPGDTLRSIALQVNRAEPATIEHELATSTGTPVVVAGEHVTIP